MTEPAPPNKPNLDAIPRMAWLISGAGSLLAFALACARGAGAPAQLSGDATVYYSLSGHILHEGSYAGMTYWPPGYPAFLALVRMVFGDGLRGIYLVQSLLLGLTLLFVYRINLHLLRSRTFCLLSTGACAIWPPIAMMAGEVMTEALTCVLFAAAMWVLLRTVEKPGILRAVMAGVLFAAATYTKAAAAPLVPVAAVIVVFSGSDRWRRVGAAAVLVVVCALLILPWTIRNHRVTGEIVPISTGGGFNFWLGNWPEYHQSRWVWRVYPKELEARLSGKPETEQDRILMREGMKYIRQDPVRATGIFARKFGYLWLGSLGTDPRMAGNPIPHIGSLGVPKRAIAYTPLFVLAILGWLLAPADAKVRSRPLLIIAAVWTAVYVAITALPRQALPLTYFEIAFAAWVPWSLWCKLNGTTIERGVDREC